MATRGMCSAHGIVAIVALSMLIAPAAAVCPWVPGTPLPGPTAIYAQTICEANLDLAISRLPKLIEKLRLNTGVPGLAVGVFLGNETKFAQAYGVRELGKPALVDLDTVFQLASVSKSLGATAISRAMAANGRPAWSDPASSLDPAIRLSRDLTANITTIGDYYSMRSGLPPWAGGTLEDLGFNRSWILAQLRRYPLFPYRDSYGYANYGIVSGAEAVATALGTTIEGLAQKYLFDPLNMTSTAYNYTTFLNRSNRVSPHDYFYDAKTQKGYWKVNEGYDTPTWRKSTDRQNPAGGGTSSLNDMLKWAKYLMNEIRSPRTALADMLKPQNRQSEAGQPVVLNEGVATAENRPQFYGFGINTETDWAGRQRFYHYGALIGETSTTYYLLPGAVPEKGGVGIVVLTNGSPVGAPEGLTNEFMDILESGRKDPSRNFQKFFFQEAFAPAYNPPAPQFTPGCAPLKCKAARPLAAYTGQYSNEMYGVTDVLLVNNSLVAVMGPTNTGPNPIPRLRINLILFDADVFYGMFPKGLGNADYAAPFNFTFSGTAAQVTTLVADWLIEPLMEKWGTLKKL